MDGRPWTVIDDMGLKMLVGEFSPEYVSSTPSFSILDKTLSVLYDEVKADVIKTLKTLRDGFAGAGYTGGYCGLQLDLTTIANREFCTASVSVIRVGSIRPEHISLATRDFPGTHKENDIREWIKKVRLIWSWVDKKCFSIFTSSF